MWRDDATLLDILRAARLALEFRGGLDKAAFLTDFKTQAAILQEPLVGGEGVKRLSTASGSRNQHRRVRVPELDWP